MKSFITYLILILAAISLQAFPRWAMDEDLSCGSCHQYQGGGGSRKAYGKDFASESVVLKDFRLPWESEDAESAFSFGLDTRYMILSQSGRDLRQFPMQFALYGGWEMGSLSSHVELNRLQEEFRLTGGLLYEGLPFESYAAIQKNLPALGWRIDDHTLFIRGGNLTPLTFSKEGLPFTPYLEAPAYFELGSAPILGLELRAMAGTSFLETHLADGGTLFYAGSASYRYAAEYFTAQVGIGTLLEDPIQLQVLSGGLSAFGLVYLGQLSLMNNWPDQDQQYQAVLHQLSRRVIPGVELVARYEFFDPDLEIQSGALQRYSVGVDLFPVSGVEIKISYRDASIDLPFDVVDSSPQWLTQIHLYY